MTSGDLRPARGAPPVIVLLWIFLVGGGCGMRDWDRDLPNGYRMGSPWSGMVYITGPSHAVIITHENETIDLVAWEGDLVLGRLSYTTLAPGPSIADPGCPPDPWFILDTKSGKWSRYQTQERWSVELHRLGLEPPPALQAPGPRWMRFFVWSVCLGLPLAALLSIGAVCFTIVHRRRRRRANARMHAEFDASIAARARGTG